MKNKVYYIICFFLFLCACAEEGTFKVGKIETTVEASMITPETAVVEVNIPKSTNNIFSIRSIYLKDHPFQDPEELDYEHHYEFRTISEDNNTRKYMFVNLSPNTTYYVILPVDYNGNNGGVSRYYYPGYSFTTAPEGDYSGLGEFKCELVDYCYTDIYNKKYTLIKLCLPDNISFGDYDCRLRASTSKNMESAIKGESLRRPHYGDDLLKKYDIGTNEDLFMFPVLEKNTYYFQIYDSGLYIYSVPLYSITINVDNSLDLTAIPD